MSFSHLSTVYVMFINGTLWTLQIHWDNMRVQLHWRCSLNGWHLNNSIMIWSNPSLLDSVQISKKDCIRWEDGVMILHEIWLTLLAELFCYLTGNILGVEVSCRRHVDNMQMMCGWHADDMQMTWEWDFRWDFTGRWHMSSGHHPQAWHQV